MKTDFKNTQTPLHIIAKFLKKTTGPDDSLIGQILSRPAKPNYKQTPIVWFFGGRSLPSMQTWDWARLRSQSWIFFWHGHKMLSKDVNHHSHTYFTLWCEKLMSRIQEKPIAHSSLTIPKFWVKKYLSRYSPTTTTYVSILWNWRCEFVKWHCHVNWMI